MIGLATLVFNSDHDTNLTESDLPARDSIFDANGSNRQRRKLVLRLANVAINFRLCCQAAHNIVEANEAAVRLGKLDSAKSKSIV